MKLLMTVLRKMLNIHFLGATIIMLTVLWTISLQVAGRTTFANTELYQDVMDRWGAPITQPAPSVRFVETGSVFNDLSKLPLASQNVTVDAAMNYRKRGLAYFSGFDFSFSGTYLVRNPRKHDVDVVFVFPINLSRNKILLSDLAFTVNAEPAIADLAGQSDKLVWTGRLKAGQELTFGIAYRGRGLDKFTYMLDPSLPVRDFSMRCNISGGTNYDYPDGVIPATTIKQHGNKDVSLQWQYKSLESGVPVGLILPSEKSFSMIIATMTRRSLPTFLLFFIAVTVLAHFAGRKMKIYESYLIAAVYAFFYVLLAYLAAFMNFYLAYVLSFALVSVLIGMYICKTLGRRQAAIGVGFLSSFLLVPTTAVMLQGYTGLIYTLELLLGLAALMWLSTRTGFRTTAEDWFNTSVKGAANEAAM